MIKKLMMEINMEMLEEIIRRVRNLTPDQQREILKSLKTLQTGKQRAFQRLKTRTDIDVVVGNRVIQTDAVDVSAGGIYINASGKFNINESVRIVFSVPGHDKPFKLQGVIARVGEDGVAIKFQNITPYFKKILDHAIWENKIPGDGSS